MKTMRLGRKRYLAALGGALLGLTGCQTWVPTVGMTLPSGHYLEHPPQYIPESPPFPLPRELATQELQASQAAPGYPALIPPPVGMPAPAYQQPAGVPPPPAPGAGLGR